jgi:hypothetical protein
MSTSDPWTGVTWNVYGGGQYLKPSNQTGQFTLTAVPDTVTGATAYYRVAYSPGDMPPCWKNCLLYPLGNVPFPPPDPLLPPYSQSTEGQWAAAAATALEELNVTMIRLEGQLSPGGNAQALTLIRVDNASTAGTPLLAMELESAAAEGGPQPLDDGTGWGSHD